MPQTDVEVRFKANVEGLRTAVQGINGQLSAVASQKVGSSGLDKMEEGARKASSAVKGTHEGVRAFGRATEITKDKLGEFTKEASRFTLGFLGVAGAFEAVKHGFEAGADVETARVRMQALVGSVERGNEAFEGLEKISDETSTGIEHVADAAQSLVASGTGLEELPNKLDAIAKAAQVTGQPIEYIADLLSRIQLRGDVSARELFRLTEATGGATRKLAEQYRDLENQQQNALEVAHRAGVASFGASSGLTQAVFAELFGDFSKIQAFAGSQLGNLASQLRLRIREGIREIAYEAGVSQATVLKRGNFSAEQLIAVSDQGRERKRNEERIEILNKISSSLTDLNVKGGALSENFTRWADSAAGKWAAATHQIDKDFEKVGGQLIGRLHEVEIAVGSVVAAFLLFKGLEFAGLIAGLKGVADGVAKVGAAEKTAGAAGGWLSGLGVLGRGGVAAGIFALAELEQRVEKNSREHAKELTDSGERRIAQQKRVQESAYNPANFPDSPQMRALVEKRSENIQQTAITEALRNILPTGRVTGEPTSRFESSSNLASNEAVRRLWEPLNKPGRTPLVNFPSTAQGSILGAFPRRAPGEIIETPPPRFSFPGTSGVTQGLPYAPALPIRPEDVQARREGRAPDQQKTAEQSLTNIDKNTKATADGIVNLGKGSGGDS